MGIWEEAILLPTQQQTEAEAWKACRPESGTEICVGVSCHCGLRKICLVLLFSLCILRKTNTHSVITVAIGIVVLNLHSGAPALATNNTLWPSDAIDRKVYLLLSFAFFKICSFLFYMDERSPALCMCITGKSGTREGHERTMDPLAVELQPGRCWEANKVLWKNIGCS